MTKDKCKNCFTVKVDGECPKCGRPVKYTEEEIVSIAAEYLSECKTSAELPTIAGLAVKAEIGRNTLYAYAKDYNTTFSNIFEKLMSEQEKVLVNKGLTGDYNSTIAKLILTKHGYSDKQDIDLSEKTFEHIRKQRDKYSK